MANSKNSVKCTNYYYHWICHSYFLRVGVFVCLFLYALFIMRYSSYTTNVHPQNQEPCVRSPKCLRKLMQTLHRIIHLCVLLAICSLSTSIEARCSGGSIAICSSDNCNTCMMSWAFSWSDASFGMPVGIRFGNADCCAGAGGGCCCGFTRGSTRWRGSTWNGAGIDRGGLDGGTVGKKSQVMSICYSFLLTSFQSEAKFW